VRWERGNRMTISKRCGKDGKPVSGFPSFPPLLRTPSLPRYARPFRLKQVPAALEPSDQQRSVIHLEEFIFGSRAHRPFRMGNFFRLSKSVTDVPGRSSKAAPGPTCAKAKGAFGPCATLFQSRTRARRGEIDQAAAQEHRDRSLRRTTLGSLTRRLRFLRVSPDSEPRLVENENRRSLVQMSEVCLAIGAEASHGDSGEDLSILLAALLPA
jgi:hypothetical protein